MEFINLRPDEIRTPENSGSFKRTFDNKAFELDVVIHNAEKKYTLAEDALMRTSYPSVIPQNHSTTSSK